MNIFDIVVFVVLLSVGYVAGRITEARHYVSIRRREKELSSMLIFTNRFPPSLQSTQEAALVSGSVVISEDYFKRALASLQSLFGGRLKSYESLLDRARREAVLRMKQAAQAHGAHMIINVKFQTFSIPGRKRNSFGAVEMLAYGTALT
jgi:uncharacterized protein YbjQ (UPF0145 family)